MKMIQIHLDRPRHLRFSINALADLEEATGQSVLLAMSEKNLGFRSLRALLWAGLRHEENGISIERAGDLLQKFMENGGELSTVMEKVALAVQACGLFGRQEEPAPSDPPAGESKS